MSNRRQEEMDREVKLLCYLEGEGWKAFDRICEATGFSEAVAGRLLYKLWREERVRNIGGMYMLEGLV